MLKQVEPKTATGNLSTVKTTPKSPLRDTFAKNLRQFRAELGWSQERLAHESGLNRTYLSCVERSEQNISLDNVHRIATALNVDSWKLLA